jgi:hypothetical protein
MTTSQNMKHICMCHRRHNFCKILEVLLFPLPVAISLLQPSLLLRALAVDNGITRHFALLFHSLTYLTAHKCLFHHLNFS